MKISELIEELQKLQSEYGDVEVVVQYRDGGGDYNGYDEDLYLYMNAEEKLLL